MDQSQKKYLISRHSQRRGQIFKYQNSVSAELLGNKKMRKTYIYGMQIFISISASLFPVLFVVNAYYRDDMQAKYMPVFVALGKSLRQGYWPVLTLQSWMGGNFAAEYQYAIYNPISLLIYMMISCINNMALGAVIFVTINYIIFSLGVFYLARRCGISKEWSVLSSISMVGNNFIYYWFAETWVPGLVSCAWLVWAFAFMLQAHKSKLYWVAAVVSAALTITAGWHYGPVAIWLWTIILCGRDIAIGTFKHGVARILAMSLATLLCLGVLLPALVASSMTDRSLAISNEGFLIPNLYGVFSVSSPEYRGSMPIFGYRHDISTPIFYVAWYIVPFFAFIKFSQVRFRSVQGCLAIFLVIMLVATQGPQQIGPLRWSFRFLPYFQLAGMLLFASVVTQVGLEVSGRYRIITAFGLVGLGAIAALQAHPEAFTKVGLVSLLQLLALAYFINFPHRRQVVIAVSAIGMFGINRIWYPVNLNVPEWPSGREAGAIVDLEAIPPDYSFYVGSMLDADFADQSLGEVGLVHGHAEINGYSSFRYLGLAKNLCLDMEGDTCESAGALLMDRDPMTGLQLADLMRVDRLIIQKGVYLDRTQPVLGEEWHEESGNDATVIFRREATNLSFPGSVSWVTPGIILHSQPGGTATEERLSVELPARRGRKIIFARPYFPGYRVRLGDTVVPVVAYRDLLLEADLPDDAVAGTLILTYTPPLAFLGVLACILGLLGSALVVLFGAGRLFSAKFR